MGGIPISVVILNQSSDLKENVIVTVDRIDGQEPDRFFRSPLKVSGRRRYDATIPPKSSVGFNILIQGRRTASGETVEGAFLTSELDLSPL